MPDTTAPYATQTLLPVFVPPSTNPYGLANVAANASPSLVDIDGDGDLDAFVGNYAGNTFFFLNTGTAGSPAFDNALANPFGLSKASARASPSFADIDGDGDLDALIGSADGNTQIFLNTGTAGSPAFAAALINPYGLSQVLSVAAPTFVDMDADGDVDAFVGDHSGTTHFFLNTGTAGSPAFAAAVANPYGLDDVGYYSRPSFVDLDADGDLDALIGDGDGNVQVFVNTGTASSPAFAAALTNPFDLADVGINANPVFVDINGDGALDAVIGTGGDTLVFLGLPQAPVGAVTTTTADGNYGIGKVITLHIAFSEDVIVDTTGGTPRLQLQTGAVPGFAVYTGGSGTSTLTFAYTVQAGDVSADLDFSSSTALELNGSTIQDAAGNDAILTLAVPGATGSLGANAALVIDGMAPHLALPFPVFGLPTTNPYGLGSVGRASPSLVDIDGDGDLDAFIGERFGNTLVYLNTGTASSPAFAAE
ncbi:MAG: VCBS repeat-containing protein, partial [Pseudomonadota bacterium]